MHVLRPPVGTTAAPSRRGAQNVQDLFAQRFAGGLLALLPLGSVLLRHALSVRAGTEEDKGWRLGAKAVEANRLRATLPGHDRPSRTRD